MATVYRSADPKSPASVAAAQFTTARRGYATDEVTALLRDVAAELDRLQAREAELVAELDQLRAEREASPDQLDEATAARLVDEETLRVLQTARESASQIKVRAEEGAARILRDATEQADQIRIDAQKSAQDIRSSATTDAAAEVEQAREQGREMVEEARAYRERVLSETARRREAAQEQIQRLLDARDHLLGVYDRAREAAARVVDEVDGLSHQSSSETPVDLSPVTGQVDIVGASDAHDLVDITADEAVTASSGDVEGLSDRGPAGQDASTEESAESAEGAPDQPGAVLYDADAEASDDLDAAATPGVLTIETADEPADTSDTSDDADPVATGDDAGGEGNEGVDGLFAKLRAAQSDDLSVEADTVVDTVADTVVDTDTDPADHPADHPADDSAGEPAGEPAVATSEIPQCFVQRDEVVQPLITKAARRAKRALADEQNTLLAALAEVSGEIVADDVLEGEDEHVDRYLEAMAPEIQVAARAGATSVDAELSGDVELSAMRELIRQGLVIPMRERLARTMVDGSEKPDAVMRQVRAVYREWKTQHMNDEVTDVLLLAYGAGVLAGVPTGTPMCWMVDPNGPACPDAEDNSLAGSVAAGEAYPTGHRLAPAHPGCRCVLVRAAD